MDREQQKYLKEVESMGKAVCERAAAEGWLMYLPDDHGQTPLQRSVNELARALRYVHEHDDGCEH